MGKQACPSALHIVDKYVYVSDWNGHCILVYESSGQLVTSFRRRGHERESFMVHTVSPLVLMVLYMFVIM